MLKALRYTCLFVFLSLLSGCGTLHVEVQVIDPRTPTATSTAVSVVEAPTTTPGITAAPTPMCPIPFFFGTLADVCPVVAAETLDAAFQVFDGGYMLWEAATSSVYVLYDDGSGTRIAGSMIATWPESAITQVPPPNHFRPIRGFNRVWTHEQSIRERLGWATGIEQAYAAQYQPIGDQSSDDFRVFMSLPNSQVIEFTALNEWHVIR